VTRLERLLLLALPLAILAGGYLAICLRFGTAWPLRAPVHESGARDLLGTMLFFDHAVGELPLDLLLAAAVAGSLTFAPRRSPRTRRLGLLWASTALLADALVVAGSLRTAGAMLTRRRVLQYLTRPGTPAQRGSHWRYHLLSQTALMALPLAVLGSLARLQRRPLQGDRPATAVLTASWVVFAGLSLACGLTAEPFLSPLFIGHQARELFTHALVTVPLALAACLALADRTSSRPGGRPVCYGAAALALAIAIYLAAATRATAAASLAQSADLVRVVCAHFFEHALSYLIVPSHAAALYVLSSRRKPAGV
jgi:hypothetical protein